jgi:hypothetical protein
MCYSVDITDLGMMSTGSVPVEFQMPYLTLVIRCQLGVQRVHNVCMVSCPEE